MAAHLLDGPYDPLDTPAASGVPGVPAPPLGQVIQIGAILAVLTLYFHKSTGESA